MTIEEKIQKILDNADSCHYRLEQVIAMVSTPNSPLSGGMAEWLRKIGVEDPRIEPTLDESLSPEARTLMFRGLIQKYHLNNQLTADMLCCSMSTIASYRIGRQKIPIHRLTQLQRILAAMEAAK